MSWGCDNLKKWNECTSISDHIGSFLNLKRHITRAGHKLDNILVIHTIFYSLFRSNIWDVVKRNLLDKRKGLTLDILTAELISVHDYSEYDHFTTENEKKAKSEQLALLAKSTSSSSYSGKRKKSNDKTRKSKTYSAGTKCHFCGKQEYWAPECYSRLNNKGDSH